MFSPLVSIIIPSYNRASFIEETLDSITAQTYPNWECIIIDDGSTDETESIVKSYIAQDERFKLFARPSSKPKGANACRNYGLEVSKGKYVVFLDSDDLITPDKLQIQVDVLEKHSSKIGCLTQAHCFTGSDKVFKEEFGNTRFDEDNILIDLITKKTAWQTASGLWLKESLGNSPFDEFIFGGQDWCFHIKQAIRNDPAAFAIIDNPTVLVRADNESISRSKSDFLYSYQRTESRLEILKTLKKQSKNKLAIKAVKIEAMKKAVRLLPVSSKKFLPYLESLSASSKQYTVSIAFSFTLWSLFIYKTYLKVANKKL